MRVRPAAINCKMGLQTVMHHHYRSSGEDTPVETFPSGSINGSNQLAIATLGDSLGKGNNNGTGEIGPPTIYAGTVYEIRTGVVTDIQNLDLQGSNNGSAWKKWGMDFYKYTSGKPVITNTASGSSRFTPDGVDNNNWSATGTLRTSFEANVSALVAELGVDYLYMCVGHCGINDAEDATPLSEIEDAIIDTFDWFFTTYPNSKLCLWRLGKGASGVTARVTAINGYLDAACALYPGKAFMVLDLDQFLDYYSDLVHLSQFGQDLAGATTAKYQLDNDIIPDNPVPYTFSAEAQAIINAFPTPLTTDEQKIVNDVFQYQFDSGDWSFYDRYVGFGFSALNNALHDWKGSNEFINDGATQSDLGGIRTGGTTTSIVRTNYVPSVNGSQWQTNSAHASVLIIKTNSDNLTARGFWGAMGASTNERSFLVQNIGGAMAWRINDNNSNTTVGTGVLNGGWYRNIRTASNAASLNQNNGNQGNTGTAVLNTDVEILIGCRNNNGVRELPVDAVFGAFTLGSGGVAHLGILRTIRNMVVSLMVL
jgi:hypothetical protein